MEKYKQCGESEPKVQPQAGHHFAAPEVEERSPHAYEGEGLGRRESLKGDAPPAKPHAEEPGHAQHK